MAEPPPSPAAPQRPEAGRHGRRSARRERRPADVRAFQLSTSVLPAVLMAILGLVAVMVVLAAGSSSPEARLALVVTAAGALAVMFGAIFAADAATRRERRMSTLPYHGFEDLQRRLGELMFLISRGREDLVGLTEWITAGTVPAPRRVDSQPATTTDPVMRLAHEVQKAQNEAWNALIDAAEPRPGDGPAQRVDIFVNLSRRMQTLSHRAIQKLDELENQVEDPDLLKGIFKVDHLTTRLRRQAESLAVVGGAAPRRQWSRPVAVYEVLRSAIAEVEHYSRVKVVPPAEVTLDGGAVADVIHLLAELAENATKFAPPHTQVFLRTESVTAGLVIEIEDRGLGIPQEAQRRLNDLLADMNRVNTDELVAEGRIGLLVVSTLARRHKITVKLQTNIYGGTQAVAVIPAELIGSQVPENDAHPAMPPGDADPVSVPSSSTPDALSMSNPFPASGPGEAIQNPVPHDGAHDDPPNPWSDQNMDQNMDTPDRLPDRRPAPASPASNDRRPGLPKRRAQANLMPELLDAPAPREDDAEISHNPGMMGAFRNGMLTGREEDLTDGTGDTG